MKCFLILFLLILGSFFGVSAQTDFRSTKPSSGSSVKIRIPSRVSIQNFITYYQGGGRITMELGMANSTVHQKMFRRIFREVGVPDSLIAISQVVWMGGAESDGLWLFDGKTAIKYGLKVTKDVDERLSFEKATRGAARHLKYLSRKYRGNWELALTAYHSGETSTDQAIKRARSKDFSKISKYLPDAARNFAANVFATIRIAEDPVRFGFGEIEYKTPLEYQLVRVPASTALAKIAEAAGESVEDIKQLNPELISTQTPAEPYLIRVPSGKAKMVSEALLK